jgi:hypothetical protein
VRLADSSGLSKAKHGPQTPSTSGVAAKGCQLKKALTTYLKKKISMISLTCC